MSLRERQNKNLPYDEALEKVVTVILINHHAGIT
jgi:hypothetical protein